MILRYFRTTLSASGGNKYIFPASPGAEIINFFHWLAS
jgi:hypothetical protein